MEIFAARAIWRVSFCGSLLDEQAHGGSAIWRRAVDQVGSLTWVGMAVVWRAVCMDLRWPAGVFAAWVKGRLGGAALAERALNRADFYTPPQRLSSVSFHGDDAGDRACQRNQNDHHAERRPRRVVN